MAAMTTAQKSPPLSEDAAISAAVYKLLQQRGETVSDLAYHTRISTASLYRKLGGQASWKAGDLGRVSRHFAVRPGDLFLGPDIVTDTATTDQKVRGSNPFGRAPFGPARRHGRRRTDRPRHLAIAV